MNRPFFRSKQDMRQTAFPRNNILHRNVFCFFSSRKEIVPPSFFRLEEKKQKKSICGAVISLFSSCLRQRVTQNGRFAHEPSVFFVPSRMCGKPPFLRITSSTAMSFVSFLQEKKSFPLLFFLEEKKSFPPGVRNAEPFSGIDRRTQGKGCTPCRSFAFSADCPSPRRSSDKCAGTCRRKHTYPCRT